MTDFALLKDALLRSIDGAVRMATKTADRGYAKAVKNQSKIIESLASAYLDLVAVERSDLTFIRHLQDASRQAQDDFDKLPL